MKEDKLLYTCESIYDAYEYGRMAHYFFKRVYLGFVANTLFYNIIISIIIYFLTKNTIDALGFLVTFQILFMFICFIYLDRIAKWYYDFLIKRKHLQTKFNIDFYKEYFIYKTNHKDYKINYNDIAKCIETDTNFYLDYALGKMVIIIEKNECELELVNMIRKKYEELNKLDNRLGGDIKFKR